jgi:aldehyde dehydrogenase (NAD+)
LLVTFNLKPNNATSSIVLTTWKLAPALASGSTCILKPSPQTPFSALVLAQIATEKARLPPGTLNVVLGDADVGGWVVGHPGVDKVSFTGSTGAGRKVAEVASGGGGEVVVGSVLGPKKLTLELGGKNAVIVHSDADLDAAVGHVIEAGFCKYII